jgi:hypothetical protein
MDKQKDAPEWEKDKYVTLTKVGPSLVATQAQSHEIPNRKRQQQEQSQALLSTLDDIVCDILESMPRGFISQARLATKVADSKRCDQLSEQMLRKDYLSSLRRDRQAKAAERFDSEQGKLGAWWCGPVED